MVYGGRHNKIYVTNLQGNSVSVIYYSNDTRKRDDIPVGEGPLGIASVGDKFYVANPGYNTVSVIDGNNDTEIRQIHVGEYPTSIGVGGFGHGGHEDPYIFVVNTGNDSVSVIDINNNSEIQRIPVGAIPGYSPKYSFKGLEGYHAPGGGQDMVVEKFYVPNNANNSVSVIDESDYEKGDSDEIHVHREPHDIPVGESPEYIAINEFTGMIYVANVFSNTISVIDGHSGKIAAGVTLNVYPANSGNILCNKKNEYTSIYLYIDVGTSCTAAPNNGFEFTGWVENLPNRNSTIPLSPFSNLTINRYGTFTANFKPVPPPIPPEYLIPLYAIVVSSIIGWSIPSIAGRLKARTQRKHLKECMSQIGNQNRTAIEEMITRYYIDGKLNEDQRRLLMDKISEHYEGVKDSKRSPL